MGAYASLACKKVPVTAGAKRASKEHNVRKSPSLLVEITAYRNRISQCLVGFPMPATYLRARDTGLARGRKRGGSCGDRAACWRKETVNLGSGAAEEYLGRGAAEDSGTRGDG